MISLYIHIPFCIRKCHYCDFLSFSAPEEARDKYVSALCNEIKQYARYVREPLYTVFFGGGTPSLLTPKQLNRIMQTIRDGFDVPAGTEISMECNPGTVNEDKLRSYMSLGINRLSIGLQSADNNELKILGRIHDLEDFEATFASARRVGIENLNVDIISAIPGQTPESYLNTLTYVVNHDPEHISAYSLMIEEGTKFHDIYAHDRSVSTSSSGSVGRPISAEERRKDDLTEVNINLSYSDFLSDRPPLPNEDDERRMYYDTRVVLAKAGYVRYEISNYSKPGYECRHNNVYWTGGNYIGAGLGASSYYMGYRYRNTADMASYLDMYSDGKGDLKHREFTHPTDKDSTFVSDRLSLIENERIHEDIQKLTVKDMMEEFMFLGLRRMDGISRKDFADKFSDPYDVIYGDITKKLAKEGLLESSGDRIRLTDRGIDVSNTVLANFLLD